MIETVIDQRRRDLGGFEVGRVLPVAGHRIDPAELVHYLAARMAHFMVPRYVRILPELPKTPTQKVQKNILRGEGVTADTWDREAAGIHIRREKLSTPVSR